MNGNRLIQAGILLFLLGLLTGLAIPAMTVPRLGLSAHLEGVMNGMVLVIVGLNWSRLNLGHKQLRITQGLLLYSTYTNWACVLLAGIWGAGGQMMPIAGANARGTVLQEGLVKFGLISLSLGMIISCLMILWGLRKGKITSSF